MDSIPQDPTAAAAAAHSHLLQYLGETHGDDLMDEDAYDHDGGASVGSTTDGMSQRKIEPEFYPCPFRKRNPVRYNIRDWECCAKNCFEGMSEVK